MATDRSPTVRGRELGRRLRTLRGDRTLQEVADALGVTPPTISRVETAARPATRRTLLGLFDLYEVDDSLRAQLLTLAREASQEGWWQKYDDLAINPLIGFEAEAKRISSHEGANVPWAFQTEEYARAIVKGVLPGIDSNVLNERVAARMERQELLRRQPNAPDLWSLIDESAFHRLVGGSRVMRNQLSKILQIAALPNVTMQIVPFEVGPHPGLNNSFTLLEFDDIVGPPMVFVESLAGTVSLDNPAAIAPYEEALKYLRKISLSPVKSTGLIKEIRKKFEE